MDTPRAPIESDPFGFLSVDIVRHDRIDTFLVHLRDELLDTDPVLLGYIIHDVCAVSIMDMLTMLL